MDDSATQHTYAADEWVVLRGSFALAGRQRKNTRFAKCEPLCKPKADQRGGHEEDRGQRGLDVASFAADLIVLDVHHVADRSAEARSFGVGAASFRRILER